MNSQRNSSFYNSLRTILDGNRQKAKRLPVTVQHALEHSLGADLSQIRVHENATLPQLLGADAFALGADIFFAPNAYQPVTDAGLRLLAHEVQHTIQQRNGRVTGQSLLPGVYVNRLQDGWEKAADRAAERALAGGAAPAQYRAPMYHAVDMPMVIQRHSSF